MEELELKMAFGYHAKEVGIIEALDFLLEESEEEKEMHIKAIKTENKRNWKFQKRCEDIGMSLRGLSWALELKQLKKEKDEALPKILEILKKTVVELEEFINE